MQGGSTQCTGSRTTSRSGGEECGTENAFYRPGEKAIVVCYEFADATLRAGDALYGDDPDVTGEFAYNVLDGIMMHEVGHALIDVYDLPTTGMEEDVVDQFAALDLVHRPSKNFVN